MSQHSSEQAIPQDMADVLARINDAYATLQATLGGWSAAQMTGPTDAAGWTVKDHIAHLAAWERSIVFLFDGRPRHEGLGVSEDLYLGRNIDVLNAAIRDRNAGLSRDEAREELASVHRELLARLDTRTYNDLLKPYSHFLPDEPGDDDGGPILDRVMGNTANHYAEHLPWMAAIVGSMTKYE